MLRLVRYFYKPSTSDFDKHKPNDSSSILPNRIFNIRDIRLIDIFDFINVI